MRGPRHAHLDGFDLHANVWVGSNDRARLEQLCRYVLRPPLAEDRIQRLTDGRVRLALKPLARWHHARRFDLLDALWQDRREIGAFYLRCAKATSGEAVPENGLYVVYALGSCAVVDLPRAGGVGEVYRARDTRLDRGVTIKVLSSLPPSDQQLHE